MTSILKPNSKKVKSLHLSMLKHGRNKKGRIEH